jgi:hypothetical protein
MISETTRESQYHIQRIPFRKLTVFGFTFEAINDGPSSQSRR